VEDTQSEHADFGVWHFHVVGGGAGPEGHQNFPSTVLRHTSSRINLFGFFQTSINLFFIC